MLTWVVFQALNHPMSIEPLGRSPSGYANLRGGGGCAPYDFNTGQVALVTEE
jgi:hypothetical protein